MGQIDTAELIRDARLRAGLTQRELAERASMTGPAIARLETGGRAASVETLERIADALGGRLDLRIVLPPGRKQVKKPVGRPRKG